MDIDEIKPLNAKIFNEKHRLFPEQKQEIKFRGKDPFTIDQYYNYFIEKLESDDINIVEGALSDLSQCFLINPAISSRIEEKHIIKVIEIMPKSKSTFVSVGFNFLTNFIKCDPSKIPCFIESGFYQFAATKIPTESVCNFIIELLKFSEKLDKDDQLNIFNYFYDNDLRRKYLNCCFQLVDCEREQSNIFKILVHLFKYQDFEESEIKKFIIYSNNFLQRANNEQLQIYIEFLTSIDSCVFYSSFNQFKIKKDEDETEEQKDEMVFILLSVIWRKIAEGALSDFSRQKDDIYIACFDFLMKAITYKQEDQFVNVNYLLQNGIVDHINDFLKSDKIKENVKVSGSIVIETIIDIDENMCRCFLNEEYFKFIQSFLDSESYVNQYIALRIISIFMQYNKDEIILSFLNDIDPIEKIIDFLNGEHYSLIIKLLNYIMSDWDVCINTDFKNEFLQKVFDLMDNMEFITALRDIEEGDDKDSSVLAKHLIKFIENYKKIDLFQY